jgi:4-amino-4-deoxy-L-arabinose transferase-like glycosyltransferase
MAVASVASAPDDRGWRWAAAAVAALAVAARVHNAFAFPPLADFDGPGHALNVFALYEGHLPSRHSWSGFHPPLSYAVGAALWRALPEAIPVHAALRLLSAAAGLGAVAVVWRTLLRFVPRADAAVVAALAACVPVVAVATSMLGNETTCTLFATAALARLCAIPAEPGRAVRHAGATALLAGLAALSKSTGLAVVLVIVATYLWQLRGQATAALRAGAVATGVCAVLLLPYYGLLVFETRSLRAVIGTGALSDEAGNEMAAQPPGERHVADYLSFPAAMLVAPVKDAPGMIRSVPGLLYASTWAEGHQQFLPAQVPGVVAAAALGALLGLLPSVLMAAGLLGILRQPAAFAALAGPLVYAAVIVTAFLVQTWVVPVYSAVKASYLLSALLPFSVLLALGVARAQGRVRSVLRAALLGIAVYDVGLTWYGWWA